VQPLVVDLYYEDLDTPDWAAIARDPRFAGAILKFTENRHVYTPEWLKANWLPMHGVARRLGVDWFCGAYHYLRFAANIGKQVDAFLGAVKAAGDWQDGDLWPIVDVEETGNPGATAASVEDAVSAFVERVTAETGRAVMLYGGSLLRDLGITSRMGCTWLWTARYAAHLTVDDVTSMGWDEASLWGWQYQGTGDASNRSRLVGYPALVANYPGHPQLDLSVMTFPGGLDALPAAL
jgi:hypothetical protein